MAKLGSLTDTLIELLRIESITGNEAEICSFVQHKLSSINPDLEVQRVANSLVVRGPFREDRSTVGLLGHLDTVPGTGYGDLVCCKEDRVIGLGASDMKGGDAVMLHLLSPEVLDQSRFKIVAVFYEREEGRFQENGLHQVFACCGSELSEIDLAFALEPTDNELHLGCVGVTNARVHFQGKRAHSARPWFGENAITKAGDFLSRLEAREPRKVRCGEVEFTEVWTATLASGGIAVNIVPDSFDINVNLRVPPSITLASAKQSFTEFVQGQAEIEFDNDHPSADAHTDNALVQEFLRISAVPVAAKQAYTDVGLLGWHGIPAVNFGPGLASQTHQAGEYVTVPLLERNFELLKAFLVLPQ